jgi:hypothetical protein
LLEAARDLADREREERVQAVRRRIGAVRSDGAFGEKGNPFR